MTTTNSDLYALQVLGKAPNPVPGGHSKQVRRLSGIVAVPVTLALNDILNLVTLPKGATVVDMWICAAQLDSNGSPTLTWNVGDDLSASTYYAASTVGRVAGTYDRNPKIGALLPARQYPADTLVYATCAAAGATKVAGNFYFFIEFTHDGYPTS